MKSSRDLYITVTILTIALLLSLASSYLLFKRGEQYYLQLNALRLDPLGLSYFAGFTPEKSGLPRLVFLGDSRAAQWQAPDDEKFEFLNRGIGAQTSVQVLERFDAHMPPLVPDVVVIQVGINDLKTIPLFSKDRERIVADCESNIQQIVERSTDLGATVILTTIFPIGDVPIERKPFWSDDVAQSVNEVNAFIRLLAADNVIILDAYSILLGANDKIKPEYSDDLLHLTEVGYLKLNEELARLLQE